MTPSKAREAAVADRAAAGAVAGTLRLVHGVLGPDLAGVYLHGSAVLGGLRPGSGVDLLAVSRRPAAPVRRRALADGLLELSAARTPDGPGRPIELAVVVESEVRPWRYPPNCEFRYGERLRAEFERGGAPAPGPCPDLAPLLTAALLGDTPLYGPPPARLLDPVPRADLLCALIAGVPQLLADLARDTGEVVLALARVWTALATGEIRTKDAAACWALARLPAPQHRVLAHARAVYLGEEPARWGEAAGELRDRARAYAGYVAHAIGRAAADGLPAGQPQAGQPQAEAAVSRSRRCS